MENDNEDGLDARIKDSLNTLIFKEDANMDRITSRGPNPQKTRKLYEHMPLIHEALLTTNQLDILETLRAAGLSTTRQTLRAVYARWVTTEGKTPRIKIGQKKKKKSESKNSQISSLKSKIDLI